VDYLVSTKRELRTTLGWEEARIEEIGPNWSELLVRFLTHPVLAGLLLSIGGLALLVELRTPGLGIPGLIGVICLALYFGAHYLVNLAGNVELLLFVGGFILIVLEVFVIPGFGAAGIVGGILLAAGLLLSRVAPGGGLPDIASALWLMIVSFIVTLVLFVLILRFLPSARWMGHIVLDTSQQHSAGYHADQHEGLVTVGLEGVCHTDLRPAGTMEVGGKRYDVVTHGDYIDRGARVRVILVKGNRIVVEQIEEA
jgi:membrane-bound serine protease (ClpP class)